MEVIMENPELQEKWREIIAAYRSSGFTAAQWCEVTGCTIGRLKYWITKFNKATQHPLEATKWTQVEIVEANPPTGTAISIYVGATRIEVASGFDHALLADVLRVVSTC
jgi:hypothetical protein